MSEIKIDSQNDVFILSRTKSVKFTVGLQAAHVLPGAN